LDRVWRRFRSLWKSARCGVVPPRVAAPQRQVAANIAARLVQVHMAIVYLYAGLGKLKGDAWWDGTAVWMAAANYEYQSGDLTWMAWYPYVPQFVTIFTVAWEVTFFLLVWRTRWQLWVLVCGVLMHLGIGAFLGMWTFGLIMIVTYVSFVPPEMVLRLQQRCEFLWRGNRTTTIDIDPSRGWTCLRGAWRGAWTPDRAQIWRIVASDEESSECQRAIGKHVTVRLLPLWLGFSSLILSGCRPDGNNPQVWHARSRLLTSAGKADEALQALNTAISLQSSHADLFYDRAKLHELAERDQEAIADYERAIALQPSYSQAHHNRAFVLLRQQQLDAAVAGFTRAIELAPKDSLAFRNRAVAHGRRGDLSSALADLERAAELVPGSVAPWMLRGEICLQAHSLLEAERSYTTAIRLHPLLAPAWRGRSTVRRQLGRLELAEADARRAHEIEPALEAAPAIPESVSGANSLNNSVSETAAAPPPP
ncbi:MAG: tetratricopeptide repeat protein, partial [Planctomycetaceae bacterium]|nr:tetratricopeptide repeat protein [Planctomycetaceae bacterium]